MEIILIILGVIAYLLLGYGWAMLWIHVLTDGHWIHEGIFSTSRSPMGVGTAVTWTVLWPITMAVALVLIVFALIGMLFNADLWKRMYRL